MTHKILTTTSVNLSIQKSNPPALIVHAKGEVSSLGWTNGRLIPYIYIQPPQDGIYEFDFVAEQPSGPSPRVISPIEAEKYRWEAYPPTLKGVRVYSSSNHIEALIGHAVNLT